MAWTYRKSNGNMHTPKDKEATTMKKENTYFDKLERIGREFTARQEAHKKLKQEIIDTYGWDSEELKAWYAQEE